MPTSTSRLSLPYPDSTDALSGFPTVSAEQMDTLDNAVTFTKGVLASLPAAGLAGRVYYATDAGLWFDDTGTSWNVRQMGNPARGYKGTGSSVAGPGWSEFLVDTISFDPSSCFSSGAFVCPAAGYYSVTGQTAITSTGAVSVSTGILKNPTGTNPLAGSFTVSQGTQAVTTLASQPLYTNVSDIIQCAAGDRLVLGCFNSASTNQTIVLASTVNYLAVQPVCGVG